MFGFQSKWSWVGQLSFEARLTEEIGIAASLMRELGLAESQAPMLSRYATRLLSQFENVVIERAEDFMGVLCHIVFP